MVCREARRKAGRCAEENGYDENAMPVTRIEAQRRRSQGSPGDRSTVIRREWNGSDTRSPPSDDGFEFEGASTGHSRPLPRRSRARTGTVARSSGWPAGEAVITEMRRHRRACAVYTRKSDGEGPGAGLQLLDAQREACEAYIASQRHEGWVCLREQYDDGGFSGGNMDRPALQRLIADIERGRVDAVIVYKIDRISVGKRPCRPTCRESS